MFDIPKNVLDRFVFVCNIKDPLADKLNPFPELMEAFLLSEPYSTPKTIELAAKARAIGSLMISDNGNFSRIKLIADKFLEQGASVLNKAKQDVVTKGSVQAETIRERQGLVLQISESVKLEQQKLDIPKIVGRQLKCNPDYIIAMEDFTIPVLHMTGMLDPIFLPEPKSVLDYQKSTQDIYLKEQIGGYGFKAQVDESAKFLVCHAFDYTSAKQAATLNKKISAEGFAISLGAPLASRNYISKITVANAEYNFKENLPESYFLSVALIMGAIGGDKKKLPVHVLGLGTPILIILLSTLLRGSKAISIDSTANFKDADDGTIYGNRDAYLKMDMYKVAALALVNDDPYQSSSPWFIWFDNQFPADWQALKAELGVMPTDNVNELASKLKLNPKLLEKYIPYFSPMRGGGDQFIKKVRLARTGTNYWVLKRICDEVRSRIHDKSKLFQWVNYEVGRYEQVASPKWAIAVRTCFEIIKSNSGKVNMKVTEINPSKNQKAAKGLFEDNIPI